MNTTSRITVKDVNGVKIVTFNDRKILDAAAIEEMGRELLSLVGNSPVIILDFTGVEFLSSAALQKMIYLDTKMKREGGTLKLCCLRHEILEVFTLTRLDRLFDIRKDRAAALASI